MTDTLTPIPRTGGNAQGVPDSVANPTKSSSAPATAVPAQKPQGLLSQLPKTGTSLLTPITPMAPASAGQSAQQPMPSAPTSQGMVNTYLGMITGGTQTQTAQTQGYANLLKAAQRGAARDPGYAGTAQRSNALRAALGIAAANVPKPVNPDGSVVMGGTARNLGVTMVRSPSFAQGDAFGAEPQPMMQIGDVNVMLGDVDLSDDAAVAAAAKEAQDTITTMQEDGCMVEPQFAEGGKDHA